jgi:hypothetical protein
MLGQFPALVNKKKVNQILIYLRSMIITQAHNTIAYKFVNPSTNVASLLNFCPKASLRLCAGSVDISNTESLTLLNCTASEHEVVVLPYRKNSIW